MRPVKLLDNKWGQEAIILVFSFILFTMNDWILILSWKGFGMGLIYFLIIYLHAQVNRFFLLPFLLKQQRPLVYLLYTIGLIFVFSIIMYEVSVEILYKNCFLYKSAQQKTYYFQLVTLTGALIYVLGITQIIEYYREQKRKNQKDLLYNQIQLNSLRGQLNPHFLFNTFNTLYGISLEYPQRTPDMIMQVSQLMRYQVENSNKELVPLADEVSFITNYIELEKERVGYRCRIGFTYDAGENEHYQVAPMLLIPFVENAFKHGTSSIENDFVEIAIRVTNGRLLLEISNSMPRKKSKIVSTRVGLKNTRERLQILYPGRHTLTITETVETYHVKLEIAL